MLDGHIDLADLDLEEVCLDLVVVHWLDADLEVTHDPENVHAYMMVDRETNQRYWATAEFMDELEGEGLAMRKVGPN
jgi:hypothetical protein